MVLMFVISLLGTVHWCLSVWYLSSGSWNILSLLNLFCFKTFTVEGGGGEWVAWQALRGPTVSCYWLLLLFLNLMFFRRDDIASIWPYFLAPFSSHLSYLSVVFFQTVEEQVNWRGRLEWAETGWWHGTSGNYGWLSLPQEIVDRARSWRYSTNPWLHKTLICVTCLLVCLDIRWPETLMCWWNLVLCKGVELGCVIFHS